MYCRKKSKEGFLNYFFKKVVRFKYLLNRCIGFFKCKSVDKIKVFYIYERMVIRFLNKIGYNYRES